MTLHFVESAPPGRTSGTPVVLLHAFPMDSLLWAAQRKSLAKAGHHVITPDLPGFGGSPLPEAEPSLDVYADELARLLDHMTVQRAIIGGLSMGGYATMAMLRRHPDRVAGIILADTKAGADAPAAVQARLAMAEGVLAANGQEQVVQAMLPNLLGATTLASRPEVVAAVRRWVLAQRPAAVAWAQRAMAARPDSGPDLAAFSGPALVLYGSEDVLIPAAEAQSMVAALTAGGAGVTAVEIPGVGHLSAAEDPQAVNSALAKWLGGLPT